MTEYMGILSGPLPRGSDPQGNEANALVDALMGRVEGEDYEPIGGADGIRGAWTITVTVGDRTHCGWVDAFAELLALADKLPRLVTGFELISYDDPLFRH